MINIHFLNVGHGDCTVIEHDSGHLTVVDINNGGHLDPISAQELSLYYPGFNQSLLMEKSAAGGLYAALYEEALVEKAIKRAGYTIELENPIHYIRNQLGKKNIFRYIQTHPDLDHFRGLASLGSSGISIANFWDVPNSKNQESTVLGSDKDDWRAYNAFRSGSGGASYRNYYRGDVKPFFGADNFGGRGDGIEILHPSKAFLESGKAGNSVNEISYVLRIHHAGLSIILGGDAEEAAWKDMVETYGPSLKCDILKASHHGRDSGYYQEAVKLMAPKLTIVSVGKKPDTDASNKYRNYSGLVLSTRWCGNIVATIYSHGQWSYACEYPRQR